MWFLLTLFFAFSASAMRIHRRAGIDLSRSNKTRARSNETRVRIDRPTSRMSRKMNVPLTSDCGQLSYSSKLECEYYADVSYGWCEWDLDTKTCAPGSKEAPMSMAIPPLFKLLMNGHGQDVPVAFEAARRAVASAATDTDPLETTIPPHAMATTGNVVKSFYGFSTERSYWNAFDELIKSATSYILLSTYRLGESVGVEVIANALKQLDDRLQSEVLLFVMYDDNQPKVEAGELLKASSWKHITLDVLTYHQYILGSPIPGLGAMHSKVLSVDGRDAIIHGANLQQIRLAAFGVWLQGSVVDSIEKGFFYPITRGWFPVEGAIRSVMRATARPPMIGASGFKVGGDSLPMLVTNAVDNTLSGSQPNSQNEAFKALINAAQERIFLQTPNLNAEDALHVILDAVSRGVDVTIYLSLGLNDCAEGMPCQGGNNRNIAKWLYSQLHYKDKLKICWYSSSQNTGAISSDIESSHLKFLSIDGKVAVFGSANWDTQSWYHSQEINIVLASPSHVEEMEHLIISSQNSQAFCYPFREFLPAEYVSVQRTSLDVSGDVMCGLTQASTPLSRRLRIGVFQGSYSPVHIGHVMGALTMREAMRLDCVWIVSTYDKSFEKVHVVPETFAARNDLLIEIIQDIPFLRMVEAPEKYKPSLPQLANVRPDIDFVFLGGEDLVDEYWNEFKRRKVMQMFVSKCPFVGLKRRTAVGKDGKVKMQALLNSMHFDYFAEIGKPIVVSRDYFSTSSTTVRNGLAGDSEEARSELRRALGRNAAKELLENPHYSEYLELLRSKSGNTTGYLTLLGRGLMKATDELVISSTRSGGITCQNAPAQGRGIFVTNLTPLRIQTLFEATMVFLTSEVPVHCIVLQPTAPVPAKLVESIQLVLRRYPFLTADFKQSKSSSYVLRIHEQKEGDALPLPHPPENVKLTPDVKTFVFPAWKRSAKATPCEDADGFSIYEKVNLGDLPPGTTFVSDALPSDPWKGNTDYQGMIDQAELPREIFETCVEIGFDQCSVSH